MAELSVAAKKALSAAKAGWYVFPIRHGAKKPPLVAHWRDESSNDPERVMQWVEAFPNCNWGLDCGRSGLTVIDVDGEAGMQTFAQYELEYGVFNPTFTVSTPSGGLHYYFKGVTRTTARTLGPGLDTRGDGGYVVFPGSTFEGRGYHVHLNAKPEKLPDWLPKLLKRAAPTVIDRPNHVKPMLDAPSNVAKAIPYLTGRLGAVQGDGGDAWTYYTACDVRDMGISESKTLELMLEHFNPNCQPEWTPEELAEKVHNAYRYAQNPEGVLTPEYDFADIPAPVEDVKPQDEDEPVPGSTILAIRPSTRNWLVEDWLPKGEIASLYGDGGQGKSLVGLQLGLSIAMNTPWFGMPVTSEPVTAFCLFCEDTRDEVNRRLHAAISGTPGEFGMERLQIWCRPGRESTLFTAMPNGELAASAFFGKFKDRLLRLKDRHKLVILDTLADVYSGSEINREHVSRFIKVGLRSLATSTNSTILLLAHPSRAGIKDGDLMSGSTAWSNSVRMRWALTAHPENPDIRVLTRMKSNYSSRGETLLLSYDNGRFVSIQESAAMPDDDPGFETDAKIVLAKICRAADGGSPYGYKGTNAQNPITRTTIRDTKKRVMGANYITRCVDYLIKMGYIENKKKGSRKALWPCANTPETIFEQLM